MALNKANTFVTTIAAGIAALSSVFAPAALANDNTQYAAVTAPSEEQQLSPGIQAARWARSNPDGVAVYVSVGTQETMTTSEFESSIKNAIEQKYGYNVEVWAENSNYAGTLLQFFYNDVATEFITVADFKNTVEEIVRQKQAIASLNAPKVQSPG